MHNCNALDKFLMNSVPGVMTFESKTVSYDDGLSAISMPSAAHFVLIVAVLSAFSWASSAVLNLRDLY